METVIDLYSKTENLVTQYEELKTDHLYLLRDLDTTLIVLISSLEWEEIEGDVVLSSDDADLQNSFNMYNSIISPVPVEHENFENNKLAFYEIGPKENHKEFYL
jgi:hypothetical protein